MAIHVTQESSSVREALPFVAWHLAQQGSLPIHNLVVRDRKDKVFGESVNHAEREVVLMVLAIDRILRKIEEHVVHPAHVPLHREAESVQIHGA